MQSTTDEKAIIEKIDIGGPSMIRGAAKNYKDVVVVADKKDIVLEKILSEQNGETSLEQRKDFAAKLLMYARPYDTAISNYFNKQLSIQLHLIKKKKYCAMVKTHIRKRLSIGNLNELFDQLNGKELSYNNLVDVDAAVQLMKEFNQKILHTFCDHQTYQCLRYCTKNNM